MKKLEELPPIHSPEAEKAVLGAMLSDPNAVIDPVIASGLTGGDFFNPANKTLFDVIIEMRRAGAEVDPGTVLLYLEDRKLAALVGGGVVLGEMAASVVSVLTYPTHLERVMRDARLRAAVKLSLDTIQQAHTNPEDLESIISQSHKGLEKLFPKDKKQKSALTIRTAKDILGMKFDDTDNIFGDRVIADGQNVTLLGPGGVGKSRLTLQFAACVITGKPFLGMPTYGLGRKWLFLQSENSNRRLQKDLYNILASGLFPEEDLPFLNNRLFIHTIENDEDSFMDLENSNDTLQIQRLIDDIDPHFVVWDPLNTFTSLDLNSDRDMRQVVSAITRLVKRGNPSRVPFVLHHSLTGKTGAARAVGWDKASYGRNSKVLQSWTRAQINLSPQSADDSTKLVMSCGKNNNGALFPEIGVLFDEQAGIYRIDPNFNADEFREAVGIDKKTANVLISATEVAALFEGNITKSKLVELIMDQWGVSKAKAYLTVDNAQAKKLIRQSKYRGDRGAIQYYKPKVNQTEEDEPK